eukprot:jgi/Chrzof1/9002/Cz03g32150.t1
MDTRCALLCLVLLVGLGSSKPASARQVLVSVPRTNTTSPHNATGTSCPPKGFDSVKNFNLTKYIAAPWYVQQQVPLTYQPKNTLYCVRAKYVLIDPKNTTKGLKVLNYANTGKVNGPAMGTSGAAGNQTFELNAIPSPFPSAKATAASKLLVAPSFVLQRFPPAAVVNMRGGGPYWVVAVGASKNKTLGYDWAIITGGNASNATGKGCIPTARGDNGGFWLFHRQPVAPAAALAEMKKTATGLGLDTSVLVAVQQKGCTYKGADV